MSKNHKKILINHKIIHKLIDISTPHKILFNKKPLIITFNNFLKQIILKEVF